MSKTQLYIGTPNGVIVCVNETRSDSGFLGVIYHSYSENAVPFESVDQMLYSMSQLYDDHQFPHSSTNERSFVESKKSKTHLVGKERIMSDDKLLQKRGDIGTFIVRVQHRQNSSWQGRITWMEEDKTIQFRSTWEMVKLIGSAVDSVSEPEESGQEPTWFEKSE